jgi:hypothetical protein
MAALMSQVQFESFLGHVKAHTSPFRYTPSRFLTPTIDNHEYLTSRIVRRKKLFKSIESKTKPFKNPVYVSPVVIARSPNIKEGQPLVRVVQKPIKTQTVQKPKEKITDEAKKASILKAIALNKWTPDNKLPMKASWYMDPRELFYRVARVQYLGGFDKAGRDGERLCELLEILAKNYIGRICFKDAGHMANMAEDLIQEATTKCVLVVDRFSVWDSRNPGHINNAFAYFTTVSRNKMYETLGCALAISDVHLEDLHNDASSIGDLV